MPAILHFNLSLYKDKVVKITLEKNKEIPYVYGYLIALLKYDNTIKSYILSHPYDTKTKEILAGQAAFDPVDVKSISDASKEEFLEWEKKYIVFRNSVIKEKGYDTCEVDSKDLEIQLTMKK